MTQNLDTLLQRDTIHRDEAQQLLRQAEDAARRARQQAEQLIAYRGDYQTRWAAEFRQGGTMQVLLCYRSFMQRLDQAVQQQAGLTDQADRQAQTARALLVQRERQLASVLKLIDRQDAARQHAGRRHEQKQIDELAQRVHQQRVAEGGPLPTPWP